MFENLTDTAGKAVLHAKQVAKRYGNPEMEPEHLLLGILVVDEPLLLRCLRRPDAVSQLRSQLKAYCQSKQSEPASAQGGDLALSAATRRALAYTEEESQRMHHHDVDTTHLLIGIFREESSHAALTLRELGTTIGMLVLAAEMASNRREIERHLRNPIRFSGAPPLGQLDIGALLASEDPDPTRDLTAAAAEGQLAPLIGRAREFDRMVHILVRRGRNSVLLVGEPGVGKTALLEGLAARLASGTLPMLLERRLVSVDAGLLSDTNSRHRARLHGWRKAILCVEGLLDMESAEGFLRLEPGLASGLFQCIATGTPAGYRRFAGRFAGLASRFELVELAPHSSAESIEILTSLRERYEKFHNVTIEKSAIPAAVYISGRVLPQRSLPDRALDLLDDAGAHAKLHGGQKVTAAEIAEAAAERAGIPVAALKQILELHKPAELEVAVRELANRLPPDQHAWLPYLGCVPRRFSRQRRGGTRAGHPCGHRQTTSARGRYTRPAVAAAPRTGWQIRRRLADQRPAAELSRLSGAPIPSRRKAPSRLPHSKIALKNILKVK
ncbi:MAG TPA: Clp protease N-terminal domain-containing protein [Bryobacteraceae bacterium]|nr:Clp protease N-terminal domain-containing protein [Bryobacteraceae bacterium]